MKEYKDFIKEIEEEITTTEDKIILAELLTIIISFTIFTILYGIIFIL